MEPKASAPMTWAFFDALMADIGSSYNIDSEQVYAVGYSNGGMMAYGLACNRGDQVAAVGIMSGVMLPGNCDAGNYTSVLHFHGTADSALPYEGNQDYQAISDVISFWVSHNNISNTTPTTTDLGGGVSKDEYIGGEMTPLWFCIPFKTVSMLVQRQYWWRDTQPNSLGFCLAPN